MKAGMAFSAIMILAFFATCPRAQVRLVQAPPPPPRADVQVRTSITSTCPSPGLACAVPHQGQTIGSGNQVCAPGAAGVAVAVGPPAFPPMRGSGSGASSSSSKGVGCAMLLQVAVLASI